MDPRVSTASPGDVSGLRLWLAAEAGVETNASGGVTNWLDQSGAGQHAVQGAETSQPQVVAGALNGKPALTFDGDDSLTPRIEGNDGEGPGWSLRRTTCPG